MIVLEGGPFWWFIRIRRSLWVKLIRSLDVATVRFKALKWRNRSVKWSTSKANNIPMDLNFLEWDGTIDFLTIKLTNQLPSDGRMNWLTIGIRLCVMCMYGRNSHQPHEFTAPIVVTWWKFLSRWKERTPWWRNRRWYETLLSSLHAITVKASNF